MILYAATIFASSFLLFLIQPVLAKQFLPWFGGSAAVWATCLVFFQVVLLAGYAYSDWTTRRLGARAQALLHIALLAASLLFLPVVPDPGWKPAGDENPSLRILGLLSATVGMPYFLLATTGPLVQAWFARSFAGRTPYRLFALSNLSSLLGLLCYPVVIEPRVTSAAQSNIWSAVYAGFALLCGASALYGLKKPPVYDAAAGEAPTAPGASPAMNLRVLWFVYAALGSFLLLAVTNQVCLNIASIPFLWVVPLSLYLLTFILCFDTRGWYRRTLFIPLAGLVLCAMAWFLQDATLALKLQYSVPLFLAGLFICCMFCHGELAAHKPDPRHLTGYYLMISLGGAAGALLVGVIAPYVLPAYFELGFGLVAVAALVPLRIHAAPIWLKLPGLAIVIAVAFGWGIQMKNFASETRVIARNFYGSLRTYDSGSEIGEDTTRRLMHGAIMHGEQFLLPEKRTIPTSYYTRNSGVGRTMDSMTGPNRRVGVIGLGAGTMAAYGRQGDAFRFYELNPLVREIARSEFTFLADSKAKIDVALGDARLSLEREPPQNFDVLVVDAFSSDSIPVHLITSEALGVYLRHMKPDGVIAFHVSNRYLDLAPVVQAIAAKHGLGAVLVKDDPPLENPDSASQTDWVLVSRNRGFLDLPKIQESAEAIPGHPDWSLWTDDFNNLFQILK